MSDSTAATRCQSRKASASSKKIRVQSITTLRCRYCSQRFFRVGSYCKHVKGHEKRYLRYWMGRRGKQRGRLNENEDHLNVAGRHKSDVELDNKNCADYDNIGLSQKSDDDIGLSQKSGDNLGSAQKFSDDHILTNKGTNNNCDAPSNGDADLVLSINKDRIYVYIVYPNGSCLCECDKENLPNSMPCKCDFMYRRHVYKSIHEMHEYMKTGVGYSCNVCKKHVTTHQDGDGTAEKKQLRDFTSDVTAVSTDGGRCGNVCPRCKDSFENDEDFRKHSRACLGYNSNESLVCSKCRGTFTSIDDLQKHSLTCGGGDGVSYSSADRWDTSSADHEGQMNMIEFMQCTVCGCSCQDLTSLNEHLKSHVKPKTVQSMNNNGADDVSSSVVSKKSFGFTLCTVCGCHFDDVASLNIHLKSHAEATLGKLEGPAGKITVVWKDQVLDSNTDMNATNQKGHSTMAAMHATNQQGCSVCGLVANGCKCTQTSTTLYKIYANPSPPVTVSTKQKNHPRAKLSKPLMVQQVHVPFKYACPICKMKFITMKELDEHKVAMHFTKHKRIAPAATKGAIMLPLPVSIAPASQLSVVQSVQGMGTMTSTSTGTRKRTRAPLLSADHLYSVLQHRNRKWKCGDCPEAFKTRDDLRLHVASEHRTNFSVQWRKWQCDVCNEVLPSRDKLKGHLKAHKGETDQGTKRNWLCSLCGFYFEKEVYLVDHRQTEHPDTSLDSAQSFVEVPFSAYDKAMQKMGDAEETQEEEDMMDTLEDETMYDKGNHQKVLVQDAMGDLAPLIVETMDSTEDSKWKCHICNSTFKNRDDLRLHIRLKHKGGFKTRGKEWQCLVCKLLLPTRDRWKSHGKVHKGEQRGACMECGIYFENHARFNTHLKAVHGTSSIGDENAVVVLEEDNSVTGIGCGALPCKFCTLKFKNQKELGDHVQDAHRVDADGAIDEHWTCLECPSAFRTLKDLHQHVKGKHEESVRQWPCATCGAVFEGSVKLVEHMEEHLPTCTDTSQGNVNRWTCSECGEIFDTRDELRLHRKDHLRKANRLKCNLCGWVFATEPELDHHAQNHMADFEELKCKACSEVFFSTVDSLKEHLRVHKDWCHLCGFKFTILHSSEKHVKVCALEGLSKDFGENSKCPECGEEFQKSVQFRLHMARHATKREKLKCKICGKLFQNIREVVQHKQASHSMDCHMCLKKCDTELQLAQHLETHVQCLYCHKEFDTYSSCKRHIESYCHSLLAIKGMAPRNKFPSVPIGQKIKRLPLRCDSYCDQCGKKFNTKEAMKTHRIVHFRGKFRQPTKCPDCDKTFIYATQLRMHKQAVHWPEKPYPCIYCQQRFKTNDALQQHETIHTRDKPHSCPMCPRKFKSKNAVQYHMNTHTGLKPFKCSYCPKTFGQPGQRITHERRHEGLRPYKCSICACSYTYGPSLKIHLKTHIRRGELDKLPDKIHSEMLQAGVKARNEAIKAAKRERIRRAKEAKHFRKPATVPDTDNQMNQVVFPGKAVTSEEEQVFEVVAEAVMAAERASQIMQHGNQSVNITLNSNGGGSAAGPHSQTVFHQDNFVVQVQSLEEV